MSARPTRPSMADVAALAGVSGQTVSRVVNGLSNVGEETRAKVEAALTELGYRPHQAARALRTGRSGALGVVVATLASVGNSLMLEAITSAAERSGRSIALVAVADVSPAAMDAALSQLAEQNVDGVIVVNEASRLVTDATDAHQLPLVLIDADHSSQHSTVRSDHEAGSAELTRLLLAHAGTVHHVAGPADSFAAGLREAGWRSALADGVVPDAVRGDWTAESGYLVGRALAADADVHAVFCANDQMALGVMRAMHEAGRAIPSDVAVAGFDGIVDGAQFWPPLTTSEQDFGALADAAVRVLVDGAPLHAVLPVCVVERASTARS